MYVTQQRISTSWIRSACRPLGSREPPLRHAAVVDGCLHRRAKSNFRFGGIIVAQPQVSFHFAQTFPEKILVVSNHALLKRFAQRKKQSLPDPTFDYDVRSSIDPEVLTANGQLPHDEVCRSTIAQRLATVFGHSQLQSLARLTPDTLFRAGGNRKPFLIVFSESGREECSSGRKDAPGLRVLGAKLRLHQIFWSQNLTFQSQNATMRPDFSSPDSLLVLKFVARQDLAPHEDCGHFIQHTYSLLQWAQD